MHSLHAAMLLPSRLAKQGGGFQFKNEVGTVRVSPTQIYTVTGEGENLIDAAKETVRKLVNFCRFNDYNVYEIKWDWVQAEITEEHES